MKKEMKHIFIVNKFSAGKKLNGISKQIEIACKELNIDYLIEYISKDFATEDIFKKYQETEYIIIAVRRRWNS